MPYRVFIGAEYTPSRMLVLDPQASTVVIRTYAEGLFARLAHDLELACTRLDGTSDDGRRARIEVSVGSIEVRGILGGGTLSPSEESDCLAKMRREVFHA